MKKTDKFKSSGPVNKASKKQLVVIGNGMAGAKLLQELISLAPAQYDITVFGAEPAAAYNRIMLSPLLAGDKTLDQITLQPEDWYHDHGIKLITGDPVVEIDRQNREVLTESGKRVGYHRLVLATGSGPFILPIPGKNLAGVVGFRDLSDVELMLTAAEHYRHAVVIGGGLLGLEAANGLLKRGMQVTVVHLGKHLMDRQLDDISAHLLKQSLEERGVEFELAAQTEALLGDFRVRAVKLQDGRELPADLVVMAAGIRPNIALAQSANLHCERAIVVDDTMQTYDPRIYAIGECVQHRGTCYGLVAPLYEQARICANHLAAQGYAQYGGSVTATTLKVNGVDLFSAGDFNGGEASEALVYRDPRKGIYKRLMLTDGRLTGAVLYGDTADGAWYFDLIQNGADVSAARDRIVFGKAYAEALIAEQQQAA